jgi:hypothetical protein
MKWQKGLFNGPEAGCFAKTLLFMVVVIKSELPNVI